MNSRPMILRFCSGSLTPAERGEELVAGVDVDDAGVQAAGEHLHDQPRLVQAQQPVVDEDAGQLVADGAVDERRRHARIDPAREAENHLLGADLRADAGDGLGDVIAHHPVGPGAADVEHEALEHRRAAGWCASLRGGTARRRNGGSRRPCRRLGSVGVEAISVKPGGSAVTLSPWLIHTFNIPWPASVRQVLDAVEQPAVAVSAHLGESELAVGAGLDLAALLYGHREHAVADAEDRHAQVPDRLRGAQAVRFVGAGVAAGEDHALQACSWRTRIDVSLTS